MMRVQESMTTRAGRHAMRSAMKALRTVLMAAVVPGLAGAAEPLRIFATTTDLGSLAQEVGGDRVSVVTMVRGRDDPHYAEARPSFIKELSQADLFVQVGLELELAYVPPLIQNARNPRVIPGAQGFLDTSRAIVPLDVPTMAVDRSMGDMHALGSPHYLLDPVRGVDVAKLISSKLAELRPGEASYFEGRYADLRSRVAVAMVGEVLAARYDAFKLAKLAELGGLDPFLRAQGDREKLSGWYAAMLPHAGARVIDDHWMWTYFARRFGIQVVGHLEQRPGIPPSTGHLQRLIERMRAEGIRAMIATPYYDRRYADKVSEATGATVIELAHQAASRPGAETWLEMVDYNVRTTAAGLAKAQ